MNSPLTVHDVHSLVEAVNPSQCPSNENPPVLIHGLVGDFDARPTASELEAAMVRCGNMQPNLYQKSLSGNARLYWFFQEPIAVSSFKFGQHLLKCLRKRMGVHKLLAGLDEPAWDNPSTAYLNSCEWLVLHEQPQIPQAILVDWVIEAAKSFRTGDEVKVPLDQIRTALEKKFPKFKADWEGKPFEIGSTGSRFWDQNSKPTAQSAMVRESGMQAFCGPRGWVSWEELVGKELIEAFNAGKIGAAVADIWWDKKDYWRRVPHEKRGFSQEPYNLDSLKRYLEVRQKLSKDEIKEALLYVEENKMITGALPFFHKPRGTAFWIKNKRYLNTALTEPLRPAERTGIQWCKEDLGWIFEFYDGLFADVPGKPNHQRNLFFSWLSRYYKALIKGESASNLIIFLAGPVKRGKNLSSEIISELVGDSADASSFFLQQDLSNSDIFQAPFWRIDDAQALATEDAHRKYSSLIKSIAANRKFRVRELYKDAKQIEWMGIVLVTLNVDIESVRLLPDIESSLLDKVMFLRTSDKPTCAFIEGEGQMVEIRKWLPNFARFLMEWEIPETCKGDSRFGVASFQEEALLQSAKQSSASNGFLEVLKMFLLQYFANPSVAGQQTLRCSASKLLTLMNQDQALAGTIRNFNPINCGKNLGKLRQQGYLPDPINCGVERQWVFDRNADFLTDDGGGQQIPGVEPGLNLSAEAYNEPF